MIMPTAFVQRLLGGVRAKVPSALNDVLDSRIASLEASASTRLFSGGGMVRERL